METRLDRIQQTIARLEEAGIPASKWRLDTSKKGTGFPRLYVPVAYREEVGKQVLFPCKFFGDYIYG